MSSIHLSAVIAAVDDSIMHDTIGSLTADSDAMADAMLTDLYEIGQQELDDCVDDGDIDYVRNGDVIEVWGYDAAADDGSMVWRVHISIAQPEEWLPSDEIEE